MPWGNWYASGGKSGEEPPAAVKKQMDLYRELKGSADAEKQKELFKQLLDISADQFYVFGISTPGQSLRRGEEQHAQRAGCLAGLDLSQPGRQQHRAVLLDEVVATGRSMQRPPDPGRAAVAILTLRGAPDRR